MPAVIAPCSTPAVPRLQVVLEQVHQQAVLPCSGCTALVVAHHAHRLETDAGERLDRAVVVDRGIHGDAMMAAVVDEMADQRPYCVGGEPLTMFGGIEEQVEAGV